MTHDDAAGPHTALQLAKGARVALRIPTQRLRWQCDTAALGGRSTADVEPVRGVSGQEDAVEALRFGLEIHAPGQNVYVRGLSGTERTRLVRHLLEEVKPSCPLPPDRVFVHDFERHDRPALITLPRGRGRAFRDRIDELVAYLRDALLPALSSDRMKARRAELEVRLKARQSELTQPFDEQLEKEGFALAMLNTPVGQQPAILPVIDGQPAPPDRLAALVQEGKLDAEKLTVLRTRADELGGEYGELSEQIAKLNQEHRESLRAGYESEARRLLDRSVCEIAAAYPVPAVQHFLAALVDDVVGKRLHALGENAEGEAAEDMHWTRRYRVNLVRTWDPEDPCPIVVETQPTLRNLVGTIERSVRPNGSAFSDHLMIVGGSLLAADGGYIVLEARDLLAEPGAWKMLVRTLRTGVLEIAPQDSMLFGSMAALKPEPIDVDIKVILIGDPGLYRALDSADPDFPQLFKVLADFDSSLPNDAQGLEHYAGKLAALVTDEGLPQISADGIAALAEHGARIAGRSDRLTARFGRLLDLAREAAYLAQRDAVTQVTREHVRDAVRRTRRRADLPARRFRERIADGTLRIDTRGLVVGQVNGLATTHAGPLTYGFPARITTTIGPGNRGTVNIEGEAQLSGSIHTKGFQILGGLMRHLLRGAEHPLSFSASMAFEQSYGGIDGDSASAAETCCLLSALTGVPLDQGVAMTGAIDQFGHVQPIGAATEKIEGFFDTCSDAGLTGEQGVIIPRSNVVDLMLRPDVVEACEAGRFHVWAVDTVGQALEVFTGYAVGESEAVTARYPDGSLLSLAIERAGALWHQARQGPRGNGESNGGSRGGSKEAGSDAPSDSDVANPRDAAD